MPRASASQETVTSGLSLTTDVAIITILDRNFGLLDNVLFFLGLAAGLVSLGLLPAVWSRGRRHRAPLIVAGFLVLAGGVVGSAGLGDWLMAAVYSGDNLVATEGAPLLVGVFWVLVGLAARVLRPTRRAGGVVSASVRQGASTR